MNLPAAARLLERQAVRGELPGSLLMTSSREDLLERESLRLAAALLCPREDPDLTCASCRRVLEEIHPDLLRLAPEGVQIRIDRVREALAFAAGRPYEAPRRVVLISRAELLGLEAGNALLKSLEEPGLLTHWVLTTTQPEALLPTILSRCVAARIPAPSFAERLRLWRDRGFSEEDAVDLALFLSEEGQPDLERLAAAREWRSLVLSGLLCAFAARKLPVLILLAENLAAAQREEALLLAELLADAALLAAGGSTESLRHGSVVGPLRELAGGLSPASLRKAALKAADTPPDSRHGNRRLHFESLLLELYLETGSGINRNDVVDA